MGFFDGDIMKVQYLRDSFSGSKGDIRDVPDDVGRILIKLGAVKNISGEEKENKNVSSKKNRSDLRKKNESKGD